MNKGRLIVLEGMDKAGKGTQCKLLNEYLNKNGKKSQVLDFPDYTTALGKEIRKFLNGKNNFPLEVQHMLLSANRWEKKETILNILNTGTTIIMDRYYQSNLVYGLSNGLDLDWLANLDKGLPKEDLVIILEISSNTSNKRVINHRDIFEKNNNLLIKVKKNYQKLAQIYGWYIIDGERSIKEVHQNICNLLRREINI
ncbi:MAG TPA: dTMP kinase [Nitrososphaeraceae archaeon]|nr:dTMP kinase [Nitrososphaeraceae archaeon]